MHLLTADVRPSMTVLGPPTCWTASLPFAKALPGRSSYKTASFCLGGHAYEGSRVIQVWRMSEVQAQLVACRSAAARLHQWTKLLSQLTVQASRGNPSLQDPRQGQLLSIYHLMNLEALLS